MKILLLCFLLVQSASAAEVFLEPVKHPLETARGKVRLHMVEHLCQLNVWAGISLGSDMCTEIIAKKQDEKDVDFDKLLVEIKTASEKDKTLPLMERGKFIRNISLYFQGMMATVQNINVRGLIDAGEEEKGYVALLSVTKTFHAKWRDIELSMRNSVPLDARKHFAEEDENEEKFLSELKNSKSAVPKDPENDRSTEPAARSNQRHGNSSPAAKRRQGELDPDEE